MTVVGWTILTCFFLLIGVTFFAAEEKQITVSNTLQNWATKYNSFAFFFGGLVGHWFFPDAPAGFAIWPVMLIPTALIGVLDYLNTKKPLPKWSRYPGWWVLTGIVAGSFFWRSVW